MPLHDEEDKDETIIMYNKSSIIGMNWHTLFGNQVYIVRCGVIWHTNTTYCPHYSSHVYWLYLMVIICTHHKIISLSRPPLKEALRSVLSLSITIPMYSPDYQHILIDLHLKTHSLGSLKTLSSWAWYCAKWRPHSQGILLMRFRSCQVILRLDSRCTTRK